MTKAERRTITKKIHTMVSCAVAFEDNDGEHDYSDMAKEYWARVDTLMNLAKTLGFQEEAQAAYDDAYRTSMGANEVSRIFRECKAYVEAQEC